MKRLVIKIGNKKGSSEILKKKAKQNKRIENIRRIALSPNVIFKAFCTEPKFEATFENTFSDAKLMKVLIRAASASRYKYLPKSSSADRYASSTKVAYPTKEAKKL
jgi:hypothetical protein